MIWDVQLFRYLIKCCTITYFYSNFQSKNQTIPKLYDVIAAPGHLHLTANPGTEAATAAFNPQPSDIGFARRRPKVRA